MKIRTILASLPPLSISLVLWKDARWAASEENWAGDSAVQFCEAMSYAVPACLFLVIAISILLRGRRPEIPGNRVQ